MKKNTEKQYSFIYSYVDGNTKGVEHTAKNFYAKSKTEAMRIAKDLYKIHIEREPYFIYSIALEDENGRIHTFRNHAKGTRSIYKF